MDAAGAAVVGGALNTIEAVVEAGAIEAVVVGEDMEHSIRREGRGRRRRIFWIWGSIWTSG